MGLSYNAAREMDLLRWYIRNWLLVVVVGLVGALQIATIRPGLINNEDACLFLSHARNLALGRPYGATGFIYTTETATYSPAAYPPVFPSMLAPLFRFSGLNPRPYKILLVCTLMLSLIVIARLYRDRTPRSQSLLLVALLGFSPFITEQKNEILSDLPFLLFVYVVLLLCNIMWERDAKDSPYWWPGICVGLLSYLAYGTRSIGVGLIPCIILFGLIRYRRIARFSIVAAGVFTALAVLQSWFVSSTSDYLRMAVWEPRAIARNLHFYIGTMANLWDAGAGRSLRLAVFVIATCVFLIGAWRVLREPLDLATLFSAGYGLFLIFWPMQQAHYLLPVVPVYLYLVVRGLFSVRDFINRRWPTGGTLAAAALACILLLTYVGKYRTSDFGPDQSAWDGAPSQQLYGFVREATPQDAVFIAGGARALALYTGRRAARFPEHMDQEALTKYIAKVGATYLIASRIDSDQWIILCRSVGIQTVFSNPSYTVYKAAPAHSEEKLSSKNFLELIESFRSL
jgi:hypothetical protein